MFIRLVEGSYPGLDFRTIARFDSITLDEAFERFVIRPEPLPAQEPWW